MSVINNVLKGLDKRESCFKSIEIPSLQRPAEASLKKPKIAISAAISLFLVLASGTLFDWPAVDSVVASQPLFSLKMASLGTGVSGANAGPELTSLAVDASRTIVELEITPLVGDAIRSIVDPEPIALAVDTSLVFADQELTLPSEMGGHAAADSAAIKTALLIQQAKPANQIIGLQVSESPSQMRLEFALQNKVVTYLKARSENLFAYHLRDTESLIMAPALIDNRWLKGFSIEQVEDGIDIEFETITDILVETQQAENDGGPMWSINFTQVVPPTPTIVAVLNQSPQRETITDLVATDSARIHGETSLDNEAQAKSKSTAPLAVVKLDIKSIDSDGVPKQQFEYAVKLINSGRFAKAEKQLTGLLQGSEDYKARQHLLALFYRQNNVDQLSQLIQEATELYPEDEFFRTEHARRLFETGDYVTVIKLLSAMEEHGPQQLALLAVSHQRLDQHQSAVGFYQLALSRDAANSKNWVGLGISQEHLTSFKAALQSYRNASRVGQMNDRLQSFVNKRSNTLARLID